MRRWFKGPRAELGLKQVFFAFFISGLIIVSILLAAFYIDQTTSSVEDSPPGYVVQDIAVSDDFHGSIGNYEIETYRADYIFTNTGLKCYLDNVTSWIELVYEEQANLVRIVLDMYDLNRYGGSYHYTPTVNLRFVDPEDGVQLNLLFEVQPYRLVLRSEVVSSDGTRNNNMTIMYDPARIMDFISFIDDNGTVIMGCNGKEWPLVEMPETRALKFEGLVIKPMTNWTDDALLWVKAVEISKNTKFRYVDPLHLTVTPYGKDLTWSMHVHGDMVHPEMLRMMANLTDRYGVEGSYDLFVYGNSRYYGMEDPDYVNGTLDLQRSGWGLGVHAVDQSLSRNRTEILQALDQFRSVYGEPEEWSDHSHLRQDLCMDGSDPASEYYVGDIVKGIGCAWWNEIDHSHASRNNLNIYEMDYRLADHPDLPLFRTSAMASYQTWIDMESVDGMAMELSAWSSDRAVVVSHDYMAYYFTVELADGKDYSFIDAQRPLMQNKSVLGNMKQNFVGATWEVQPKFEQFLEALGRYDVWYAPVREIYDRSVLVNQISLEEKDDKVLIDNGNKSPVQGLTIYTNEKPDYYLKYGDEIINPSQGSNSWHFVIDNVMENSTMELTKVRLGDAAAVGSSVPIALSSWILSDSMWSLPERSSSRHP